MTEKTPIDARFDVLIPHPAELTIRTATKADLSYIADRSRRWRKRVGYLPAGALRHAIARRWAWIAQVDGLDAGHVLLTGGDRVPAVLRHNCIEEDLWHNGIGTVFTRAFVAWATLATPHKVARVRTRADIRPQLAINLKTGGTLRRQFEPNPYSNGHGVTEWHWRLRHNRLKTAPETAPITTGKLLLAMETQPNIHRDAVLPQ